MAVARKGERGFCHARSCPAPQGAGAGERVLSWPPAWGGIGAPLEGAAAGGPAAARAVSVFRLARPRSCWAWRVGSVLRLQTPKAAPFPGGTETHDVGGVPGRDAGGVGGPGIGSDLRPGEEGLRHRRPRAARLLRTPCRIPGSLGEALGAAAGPPSTVPSRVRACVRVARPLPGSHPAGAAFATAARVLPTSRRRGPFRPHASSQLGCGPRTCSQLDSWTRPAHSCLSSEKGGAHLVGRVQLLLVNRFFKVSE